ncbi:hypothetical protein M422DRAFT_271799 [Sphaerobolus stellatus SS14]|uniref:Uncharacterized protein n=1 Tax=Sphaerobolus stellatus (strain SS14) TaxID=990650 RepID=A0A0C9UNI5_SPHS4|nr:hypothetical protein M422DRAFT_271799 [Sphaerobolus stellatus SS14]
MQEGMPCRTRRTSRSEQRSSYPRNQIRTQLLFVMMQVCFVAGHRSSSGKTRTTSASVDLEISCSRLALPKDPPRTPVRAQTIRVREARPAFANIWDYKGEAEL